jgi:hypothetical protein
MKNLFTSTAVIEGGTGLALLGLPALVVQLLLGAEISGAAIPLGRVGGAALLALAVACWLARGDSPSASAKGLVAAMLTYNLCAVAVLANAGVFAMLNSRTAIRTNGYNDMKKIVLA